VNKKLSDSNVNVTVDMADCLDIVDKNKEIDNSLKLNIKNNNPLKTNRNSLVICKNNKTSKNKNNKKNESHLYKNRFVVGTDDDKIKQLNWNLNKQKTS